jgi:hypothetical protein
MSARDGMESYRTGDMQLRVSLAGAPLPKQEITFTNSFSTDSMGCRFWPS